MLMFKRIYKARFSSDYWVTFESLFPENKRPENERDDMLAAYYRRVIGDDEAIKVETCRGWCSWGF